MVAILSDNDIRKLCKQDPPLLKDFLDFETQLQPTGFDVTVRNIVRLQGNAQIGGPYHNKVATEISIKKKDGYYKVKPGMYIVYINEYTSFPNELMGMVFPRSTLFRAGGILQSGVWDGGFCGRGRLGLLVQGVDELLIEHNCPIAQMVFFRSANVEEGFKYNEFYIDS